MTDLLAAALTQPFFLRALIAGLLVAVATGLVGVFVVLRKLSFFSDAVAHFALTGIALGFLLGTDPIRTAVVFSVLVALGIGYVERHSRLSTDTTIGVFFSGAAALGIFLIGLLKGYRADLFQYLFGDILAVSWGDIGLAAILVLVVVCAMAFAWRPLLALTFNRDLAEVRGWQVERWKYLYLIALAVVTAVSIKTVGVLLVTALTIVPAATAKNVARSARQLLILTVTVSTLSVIIGLFCSYVLNTASGPTIVLTSLVFFILTLLR